MAEAKSGVTSEQKLTAGGLLVAICAAFFVKGQVPTPYILVGSVGFGIGTAASVGYYRLCSLLKNGRAEHNKFGRGLLTGAAIFSSLLGSSAVPSILSDLSTTPMFNGIHYNSLVLLMIATGGLGFLQNRSNTLESLVDEARDA
jgi:hypothetical protein